MMRVNVDRDAPTFWLNHFDGPIEVRLDGVKQLGVVEADDDLGYVEIDVGLREGVCALTTCDCGQRVLTKLAFGRVEFIGTRRRA
jgi:hypothetical protein